MTTLLIHMGKMFLVLCLAGTSKAQQLQLRAPQCTYLSASQSSVFQKLKTLTEEHKILKKYYERYERLTSKDRLYRDIKMITETFATTRDLKKRFIFELYFVANHIRAIEEELMLPCPVSPVSNDWETLLLQKLEHVEQAIEDARQHLLLAKDLWELFRGDALKSAETGKRASCGIAVGAGVTIGILGGGLLIGATAATGGSVAAAGAGSGAVGTTGAASTAIGQEILAAEGFEAALAAEGTAISGTVLKALSITGGVLAGTFSIGTKEERTETQKPPDSTKSSTQDSKHSVEFASEFVACTSRECFDKSSGKPLPQATQDLAPSTQIPNSTQASPPRLISAKIGKTVRGGKVADPPEDLRDANPTKYHEDLRDANPTKYHEDLRPEHSRAQPPESGRSKDSNAGPSNARKATKVEAKAKHYVEAKAEHYKDTNEKNTDTKTRQTKKSSGKTPPKEIHITAVPIDLLTSQITPLDETTSNTPKNPTLDFKSSDVLSDALKDILKAIRAQKIHTRRNTEKDLSKDEKVSDQKKAQPDPMQAQESTPPPELTAPNIEIILTQTQIQLSPPPPLETLKAQGKKALEDWKANKKLLIPLTSYLIDVESSRNNLSPREYNDVKEELTRILEDYKALLQNTKLPPLAQMSQLLNKIKEDFFKTTALHNKKLIDLLNHNGAEPSTQAKLMISLLQDLGFQDSGSNDKLRLKLGIQKYSEIDYRPVAFVPQYNQYLDLQSLEVLQKITAPIYHTPYLIHQELGQASPLQEKDLLLKDRDPQPVAIVQMSPPLKTPTNVTAASPQKTPPLKNLKTVLEEAKKNQELLEKNKLSLLKEALGDKRIKKLIESVGLKNFLKLLGSLDVGTLKNLKNLKLSSKDKDNLKDALKNAAHHPEDNTSINDMLVDGSWIKTLKRIRIPKNPKINTSGDWNLKAGIKGLIRSLTSSKEETYPMETDLEDAFPQITKAITIDDLPTYADPEYNNQERSLYNKENSWFFFPSGLELYTQDKARTELKNIPFFVDYLPVKLDPHRDSLNMMVVFRDKTTKERFLNSTDQLGFLNKLIEKDLEDRGKNPVINELIQYYDKPDTLVQDMMGKTEGYIDATQALRSNNILVKSGIGAMFYELEKFKMETTPYEDHEEWRKDKTRGYYENSEIVKRVDAYRNQAIKKDKGLRRLAKSQQDFLKRIRENPKAFLKLLDYLHPIAKDVFFKLLDEAQSEQYDNEVNILNKKPTLEKTREQKTFAKLFLDGSIIAHQDIKKIDPEPQVLKQEKERKIHERKPKIEVIASKPETIMSIGQASIPQEKRGQESQKGAKKQERKEYVSKKQAIPFRDGKEKGVEPPDPKLIPLKDETLIPLVYKLVFKISNQDLDKIILNPSFFSFWTKEFTEKFIRWTSERARYDYDGVNFLKSTFFYVSSTDFLKIFSIYRYILSNRKDVLNFTYPGPRGEKIPEDIAKLMYVGLNRFRPFFTDSLLNPKDTDSLWRYNRTIKMLENVLGMNFKDIKSYFFILEKQIQRTPFGTSSG